MNIEKSSWSYSKARRTLLEPRVGHKQEWHYTSEHISKEAKALLKNKDFPIEAHMVLKYYKNEYFLIREAKVLNHWLKPTCSKPEHFLLKFGECLYLDPTRYRVIVSQSEFSWHKIGMGHQLIHKADTKYSGIVQKAPIAYGQRARFLFYNYIEQRLHDKAFKIIP